MENIYLGTVILLLLSCGLCDDLSPEEEPSPVPPELTNETEDEQWNKINVQNAEAQCLKETKDFAVEQGFPEFTIFDCECTADETTAVKTYTCVVSAADGEHNVTVNCIRSQRRCVVDSEAGTSSYNFDVLEQLLNE